jgi:hypothetical protein
LAVTSTRLITVNLELFLYYYDNGIIKQRIDEIEVAMNQSKPREDLSFYMHDNATIRVEGTRRPYFFPWRESIYSMYTMIVFHREEGPKR